MKVLSYSEIQDPARNNFYNAGVDYKIANYRKNLILEEENAERQQAIMDKEYWQELATQAQAQELVDLYNALAGKEDFKQIVNLLKNASGGKQIQSQTNWNGSGETITTRKNAGFELPKAPAGPPSSSNPLPVQNVRGKLDLSQLANAKNNLRPQTTTAPKDKPKVNTNPFGLTPEMVQEARMKLRNRKSTRQIKIDTTNPYGSYLTPMGTPPSSNIPSPEFKLRTGGIPRTGETPRTGGTPLTTSPNALSPKTTRQRSQQNRRMDEKMLKEVIANMPPASVSAESVKVDEQGKGFKKKTSKANNKIGSKPSKARKLNCLM